MKARKNRTGKALINNHNNIQVHLVSEKAMAPHSSTLAWKIPWTEEPGGLSSMGSYRVGHNRSDLAAAAAAAPGFTAHCSASFPTS